MRYVSGMSAFMAALALSAASPACAIAQATVLKPDTAAVLTVVLPRIAQSLSSVTITSIAARSRLQRTGFYDRWLQRQKGTSSAMFMGPEEIEKRHPTHTSALLFGLSGVSIVAALEVYARGATMPASLQAADNSCGVIAIWTGSRR